MKVVLDTNVVVSGLFFGGRPRAVLDAWADGRVEIVLTPWILRCAHAAGAVVVSGDRHLLDVNGWRGVQVMTPGQLAQTLSEGD